MAKVTIARSRFIVCSKEGLFPFRNNRLSLATFASTVSFAIDPSRQISRPKAVQASSNLSRIFLCSLNSASNSSILVSFSFKLSRRAFSSPLRAVTVAWLSFNLWRVSAFLAFFSVCLFMLCDSCCIKVVYLAKDFAEDDVTLFLLCRSLLAC